MRPHHQEGTLLLDAAPEEVFRRLDDHVELASHMTNSSWMMGGGKAGSRVMIFIDYEDPPPGLRWLGRILGPASARWCVRSMLEGAARALASGSPEQSTATRKELMPIEAPGGAL